MKLLALILCGIMARNLYALPCYVAEISDDMVCFADYAGNGWWQDGTEGWELGDGANLVMFDNFTAEYKYDDIIIRATYDRPGYVEYLRGDVGND